MPYGLLLAWAVHDLEEVLAFERWKRTAVPRLRTRFPRVPGLVWQRLESTNAQDFALAVAIVGVFMAMASAAGQASGGRGVGEAAADLRHAAVSTWLNAGVDRTQGAGRAGHNVQVFLQVYAKCIVGRDEIAWRRVEAALGHPA